MSAAMFAKMKELEARVKTLEQQIAVLNENAAELKVLEQQFALMREYGGSGPRPTIKMPEKSKVV